MKTVKEILEAYNKDYTSKLDPRFGAKFPPEKDIPNVINLRRKAIRVFPDGQKIALYYSPQLDRYVSIPYGPGTQASGIQINEAKTPQFDTDVTDEEKAAYMAMRKGNVSRKDIMRKLPIHQIVKTSGTGAAAGEAIRRYRPGGGAFLAGQLMGLGARGLVRGALKLGKKVVGAGKSKPKPLPESFKEKVQYLREENLINEEVRKLEERWHQLDEQQQLNEVLPAIIKLASRYGIGRVLKKFGPSILRGMGRKLKNTLFGDDKSSDQDSRSDSGSQESAWDYARRRGKEASTPDKTVQFGRVDPRSSGGYQSSQDILMQRRGMGIPDPKAIRMQENTNNFNKIKTIVENNLQYETISFGDDTIKINNRIAKKVINLYESLNKDNKKKVEAMLDEDVNSFKKIINFAIRQ